MAQPEWQEIGTAPRDGTEVLVWEPDHHEEPRFHYYVAWFSKTSWVCAGDDYDLWVDPTHWQPLPDPPLVPNHEVTEDK